MKMNNASKVFCPFDEITMLVSRSTALVQTEISNCSSNVHGPQKLESKLGNGNILTFYLKPQEVTIFTYPVTYLNTF